MSRWPATRDPVLPAALAAAARVAVACPADAFNRLRTVSGTTDSASYTYDRLDRLASVTEGSYSTIFGAWSAGTETNIPGQPRHAPRSIGNPSNQFGYDPAGTMTLRWLQQGGTYTAYTQQFNVDNRLYQVIGTGTTTTYDLDAHTGTTLRRTQTSGGTTTVTDFVLKYYQKNVTAGTGTVYYSFGDRLVAQLSNKRTFIHGDHLGSTVLVTDGAGAVLARYRYHAYRRQREGSSLTERRFTGQRVEDSSYLYDYQARYYAPALGLFVSPDPLVPEPGRPAALNRYAYGYNNPVKFVDPTGYDGCAASDRACWEQEWYAKDRWYRAHGYFFNASTGHWDDPRFAQVDDVDIAREVLGEFGVVLNGSWSDSETIAIATGVADLGRVVGGVEQFGTLTGGTVTIRDRSQRPWHGCLWGGGCTPPPWVPGSDGWTIYAYGTVAVDKFWTVHELAHVIDWHSSIRYPGVGYSGRPELYTGHFSAAWAAATTTDYGVCVRCVQQWERWAEAVTTYVYGPSYSKTKRVLSPDEQAIMSHLLRGWGWK